MANANARRLTSADTASGASPEEKLEQIRALLDSPAKVTLAMLKMKIWAIDEDIDLPADKRAFMILAARAGLRQRAAYNAWGREFGPESSGPVALRVVGNDGHTYWVAPRMADSGTAPEVPSPEPTDLYRWYDEQDLPLYFGISDDLRSRSSSHFGGSSWMEFAVRSTFERHPTRSAALAAEEVAIKAEHPLFNKQHNDTPEARRRVVEYLIEHDRLDLLAPAVSRG